MYISIILETPKKIPTDCLRGLLRTYESISTELETLFLQLYNILGRKAV